MILCDGHCVRGQGMALELKVTCAGRRQDIMLLAEASVSFLLKGAWTVLDRHPYRSKENIRLLNEISRQTRLSPAPTSSVLELQKTSLFPDHLATSLRNRSLKGSGFDSPFE